MSLKKILIGLGILLTSTFVFISCADKKEESKKAEINTSDPIKDDHSLKSLNSPKLNSFSISDTSSLKCYINTYSAPYKIKIFNAVYFVSENKFSAFIAEQKNEFKKYRVYLLINTSNTNKKTIDILDVLTTNDIVDFEIVEDGKVSR